MSKESSPESSRDQRGARFFTHDQPIIIDGTGSVALEFDAEGDEHYEPDDLVAPTKYTGDKLQITSVTVFVKGRRPHSCPVPSDGRCTITVVGRAAQANPIVLDGRTEDVIVITPDRAYEKHDTGSVRKRHRSGVHKIESLTIQPASGGQPYVCPEIPNDGKCIIRIIDDHIS